MQNETSNMKKLALLYLLVLFTACNTNNQQTTHSDISINPEATSATEKNHPLMNKYDCSSCHKQNERLTGPSYNEIAEKYKENKNALNYLANKIIEGGSGNWGSVPMNPHPGMPIEDAKAITEYILTLKK